MGWQEQRDYRNKENYDRAKNQAMAQWDDKTRSRTNLIMGCVVFPLVVALVGAMFVGAYLSGEL